MLVDEIKITLKAGHGGQGRVSFYKPPHRGPDGGNGGKGGSIYIKTTSDLSALSPFTGKHLISAENGGGGGSQRKFGKDGKDLELTVPVGSVIREGDDEIELTDLNDKILIAKGGLGGRGNYEFKSARNTTPMQSQTGLPGEEREIEIILKLIADFGLIGLPNAGKSSLLNELSAANAKVAQYPFTTLEPNLGSVSSSHLFETEHEVQPQSRGPERSSEGSKIIADIPGLIEGASIGKGLGIKFLKHIEKTKVLLHCIASDSSDPKKDYQTVRQELSKYNKELLDKDEIILLTKSDLLDQKILKSLILNLKSLKRKVFPVSIHDLDSIEKLKTLILNY